MKRPDQSVRITERNTTHGMTHSPAWRSWSAMRNRCNNPNAADYPRYGARGIRVCDRWSSFENFHADMGPRPDGTTLGRIDNAGHYAPGNCRWETIRQQARNTRTNVHVTHDGLTLTVIEWAERTGISAVAIYQRIDSGWPASEAVTVPLGVSRPSKPPPFRLELTHCKRGHPLSGSNLRVNSRGHRSCRTCNRKEGRLNPRMVA